MRASPPRAKLPPRAPRGTPDETRARLVAAAAEVFNRDGYDGTDSNRLARAAGYAPGTFYKHFADKKAVFLAVYEEWVAKEWSEVPHSLAAKGDPAARAERIVDVFLAHHRRWRGFRASLRALIPVDAEIRAANRALRRAQLEVMVELRRAEGAAETTREEDALLVFTVERVADALADGEAEALRLRSAEMRALLVRLVAARLTAERPAS